MGSAVTKRVPARPLFRSAGVAKLVAAKGAFGTGSTRYVSATYAKLDGAETACDGRSRGIMGFRGPGSGFLSLLHLLLLSALFFVHVLLLLLTGPSLLFCILQNVLDCGLVLPVKPASVNVAAASICVPW